MNRIPGDITEPVTVMSMDIKRVQKKGREGNRVILKMDKRDWGLRPYANAQIISLKH